MKSSLLVLILLAFMGIISIQSGFFHSDSHCASETHHAEESGMGHHEHMHAGHCCSSLFFAGADSFFLSPEMPQDIFNESTYVIKPGPYLDGPLQPPRLA